ncbi:hypothetical protein DFH09DRAFT_1341029 [Mycena vulgaris]|nr:hypothetical protein DFH09DRAFT_1341029 [Mycena vulgaris]
MPIYPRTSPPHLITSSMSSSTCHPRAPVLLWLPSTLHPPPRDRKAALSGGDLPCLRHPAHCGTHLEYDASNTELPDLSPATALRTLEITAIQCTPNSTHDRLVWIPALLS